MMYDSIFAKSFSKHERQKLGWGAFLACFIIALTLCTVFKPYLVPLPILNLGLSTASGLRMLMSSDEPGRSQESYSHTEIVNAICSFNDSRSDVCEMKGDIRILGNSSTIFYASHGTESFEGNNFWSIRPYARKGDNTAMGRVRKVKINVAARMDQEIPRCTKNFSIPAIVFSTGGYAGNHFHDFSDVLIPLYLNAREFDGEIQFLVTDKQSWWTSKYKEILWRLSNYGIIDIDKENDVLCFPSMIVGLKAHKEFSIDPSTSRYSMKDFRQFLSSTYSLKRESISNIRTNSKGKIRPRLLIISRKKTRRITNEREIVDMARSIGFNVVVKETGRNVPSVSHLVNSCDVLVGVHGAGLTNMVFLPDNALVVQIVPLGLDSLAANDFEEPAKDMNLRYLKYTTSLNESSLSQQYLHDHQVLKDPGAIHKKGWDTFRSVYLDNQNVKIDITRFRGTLLKAFKNLQI